MRHEGYVCCKSIAAKALVVQRSSQSKSKLVATGETLALQTLPFYKSIYSLTVEFVISNHMVGVQLSVGAPKYP